MLGFPGVVDHHQTERSATRRYVLAVTVGAYGDVHVRPARRQAEQEAAAGAGVVDA